MVDGVARTFYAINGQEVHPISYGGTTYLPVRSIGELMNKNVDWNNDTKTITLTSPRTTGAATGTPRCESPGIHRVPSPCGMTSPSSLTA